MNYVTFLLEFPNGYHVSDFRISNSNIKIHSDVLFSALIHESFLVGGQSKVDQLVKLFEEKNIVITDLFPFIDDQLYIPRPMVTVKRELEDMEYRKEIKKINFIPENKLHEYLQGDFDIEKEKKILNDMGEFSDSTKIMYKENGDHEIFTLKFYKFNKNNGLYFIFGYNEEEDLNLFDDLMFSLSCSGIGGKKSIGLGKFFYTYEKIPSALENRLSKESKKYMLLNTSLPNFDELDENLLENSSYKVVRKGGFITRKIDEKVENNKRKRDMFFFESGSTFEKKYKGNIFRVDIDNPYPIYRYGLSTFLGVDDE